MGREHQSDQSDITVNEAEGAALGVICRRQPITRYQLLRAFQLSPVTHPNKSKGSLYPLVSRLLERSFLSTEPGGGARDTEVLRLTERGQKALRQWVNAISSAMILPHDPLKARVVSLGELSRDERIEWIAAVKSEVLRTKEELAAYASMGSIPYGDILNPADDASLDAKLQWLDRLLIKVVNERKPRRRSFYRGDDHKA